MSGKGIDLSYYDFGKERPRPAPSLQHLSAVDKIRLAHAGISIDSIGRSASFIHVNHAACSTQNMQEGLELMDINQALKKYDGLPGYYWKVLSPDKDEFTQMTKKRTHGGYFVRVRKGVKLPEPVQSCMFIQGNNLGQSVHNIIVVEEGAELHIISGCATSSDTDKAAHLGISEYYVEKGGKLTFTMVHNWGSHVVVRPRSAGVVAQGGTFINNYVLLDKVRDLQMYPTIHLQGSGASALFNSVIVAPPGSHVDVGNKVVLDAPNTRAEIVSRSITTGGVVYNRGHLAAHAAPVKGHLECKGLILGKGVNVAIPEIEAMLADVELSHEAAIGKIAQAELEYLMARGLDEDQATATIVSGFLNLDIMGLPAELKASLNEQIAILSSNKNAG